MIHGENSDEKEILTHVVKFCEICCVTDLKRHYLSMQKLGYAIISITSITRLSKD